MPLLWMLRLVCRFCLLWRNCRLGIRLCLGGFFIIFVLWLVRRMYPIIFTFFMIVIWNMRTIGSLFVVYLHVLRIWILIFMNCCQCSQPCRIVWLAKYHREPAVCRHDNNKIWKMHQKNYFFHIKFFSHLSLYLCKKENFLS